MANADEPGPFPGVTREQWRAKVEAALDGAGIGSLATTIPEGLAVAPLFSAADGRGLASSAAAPGCAPYVRGGALPRARVQGWMVAHRYTLRDPEQAAAALHADLEHAEIAPWLRLDGGARRGDPIGSGNTGGLEAADATTLARVFDGNDLGRTSVLLDGGATARASLAMLVVVAEAAHVDPTALTGGVLCDPLGTLATEGHLGLPLDRALAGMAETTRWANRSAPALATIAMSGIPYHDAGAPADLELALTLATGAAYLRALIAAGLDVAVAGKHMVMQLSVADDMFVEIAKLRAARLLWAGIVQRFGGDAGAQHVPIHVLTSRRCGEADGPWDRVLCGTVHTFAAVAGGADVIATRAFDDGALARRMAINTQLILRDETHLHRVLDPGGGSHYVEHLTEALARRAWERVREIEGAGGVRALLEEGRLPEGLGRADSGSAPARRTGRGAQVDGMDAALDAARDGATIEEIAAAYGGGDRTGIPVRLAAAKGKGKGKGKERGKA